MDSTQFCFLLFVGLFCIEANQIGETGVQQDSSVQLDFLGSVDGKSYYENRFFTRNWFDAQDICWLNGMQLATITTAAEVDLLRNVGNETDFTYYHWTGAREARIHRGFSWDDTNAEISEDLIDPLYEGGLPHSSYLCVDIASTDTLKVAFTMEVCTWARYTLCETYN